MSARDYHGSMRRQIAISGLAAAVGLIALGGTSHSLAADEARHEVVFTDYTPLAGNSELARRLLSPLVAAEIPAILARAKKTLVEQPINLAGEKFLVYAPPLPPAHGYALLVFIPPWDDERLPSGWTSVLDRYGMIFVSAEGSGNAANPLARREPLALLAAQNLMKRYPVDPERIYIGGFSGGSRIAMRLALAYPDLFRGALLNAGGDPIGDSVVPLPPQDLMHLFQTRSRLVYATGGLDTVNLDKDSESIGSMNAWCVFDIASETLTGRGHQVMDAAGLSDALRDLVNPLAPNPAKLNACRSKVEGGMEAELDHAQMLVDRGDRDSARRLLKKIDTRYGGLASPRSVDLMQEIDAH